MEIRTSFTLPIQCLFCLLLFPLSLAVSIYAASDDIAMPDTMQIVKEGDVGVVVPRGGRIRKESSFMVKEDPEDYASRKFSESETRFQMIEKEIALLKDEVASIKTAAEAVRADSETPAATDQPAEIQITESL